MSLTTFVGDIRLQMHHLESSNKIFENSFKSLEHPQTTPLCVHSELMEIGFHSQQLGLDWTGLFKDASVALVAVLFLPPSRDIDPKRRVVVVGGSSATRSVDPEFNWNSKASTLSLPKLVCLFSGFPWLQQCLLADPLQSMITQQEPTPLDPWVWLGMGRDGTQICSTEWLSESVHCRQTEGTKAAAAAAASD